MNDDGFWAVYNGAMKGKTKKQNLFYSTLVLVAPRTGGKDWMIGPRPAKWLLTFQ